MFTALVAVVSDMPLKGKVFAHCDYLAYVNRSPEYFRIFPNGYLRSGMSAITSDDHLSSAPHAEPQAEGFSSGLSPEPQAEPQAEGLSPEPHAAGLSLVPQAEAAPGAEAAATLLLLFQSDKFASAIVMTSVLYSEFLP